MDVKHRAKKQSNIKKDECDISVAVEGEDCVNSETHPECTEEEIYGHQQEVLVDVNEAVEYLYDPAHHTVVQAWRL